MARRQGGPDPKQAALAEARCLHPHPEQVADPEFLSSDFFDARDAVQVKYEMVRKVKAGGAPVTEAAAAFGRVGSPEVMTAQLARLTGVARLPNVTVQVVPNAEHAGFLGGFAIAERAAYVETAVAGQVFEDQGIIDDLLTYRHA